MNFTLGGDNAHSTQTATYGRTLDTPGGQSPFHTPKGSFAPEGSFGPKGSFGACINSFIVWRYIDRTWFHIEICSNIKKYLLYTCKTHRFLSHPCVVRVSACIKVIKSPRSQRRTSASVPSPMPEVMQTMPNDIDSEDERLITPASVQPPRKVRSRKRSSSPSNNPSDTLLEIGSGDSPPTQRVSDRLMFQTPAAAPPRTSPDLTQYSSDSSPRRSEIFSKCTLCVCVCVCVWWWWWGVGNVIAHCLAFGC